MAQQQMDHFLTAVPRTDGGGSTSIRISIDSIYTRVIVAGGSAARTDDGGFGGGMNGGNCYYLGELQTQGSGTQTCSSCSTGYSSNGDPSEFGKGATGQYRQGGNSGGGGGGGYGCTLHSSNGGGGSGWVFTENNFQIQVGMEMKQDTVVMDMQK